MTAIEAMLLLGKAKDLAFNWQAGDEGLRLAFQTCIDALSENKVVMPAEATLGALAAETLRLGREKLVEEGDILQMLRASLPVPTKADVGLPPQGREESPAPRQPEIDVAAIGAAFGESVARYLGAQTQAQQAQREVSVTLDASELTDRLGDQIQEIVDTWDTRCPQVAHSAEERRSYPRYVWHRKGPKVEGVGPAALAAAVFVVMGDAKTLAELVTSTDEKTARREAVSKAVKGWRQPTFPLTFEERIAVAEWAAALVDAADDHTARAAATRLAELKLLFGDGIDDVAPSRALRARLQLARHATRGTLTEESEQAWIRLTAQPTCDLLPRWSPTIPVTASAPSARATQPNARGRCFNCGDEGHEGRACPLTEAQRCYRCKAKGHPARGCAAAEMSASAFAAANPSEKRR
jgi:hypothetical protein